MKKILLILSLAFILNVSKADDEVVVGLWQKIPVSENGYDVSKRTSFIFTNKKIAGETVFSALRSADPLSIICCLEVRNINILDLNSVIKKYSYDSDFVEHMQAIKGVAYMYEAVPVEQSGWNNLMKATMKIDENPHDLSPVTAPVISARLGENDKKLGKLELGPTKAKLSIKYPKSIDKAIYTFLVNGKVIVISEKTFPH
jgi:hypothetical protein